MKNIFAAILFLTMPTAVFAQASYFKVVGVASDDTLNVRAEPNVNSADIGDLSYFASAIEVAGTDPSGKWGRIVWQEGNGWISMRFLEPDDVPRIGESILPEGLFCGGTEPFWGSEIVSTGVKLNSGEFLSFSEVKVAAGRASVPVNLTAKQGGLRSDLLIRPANCSDGMSDRIYPWSVDFISTVTGTSTYQVGCCYLP